MSQNIPSPALSRGRRPALLALLAVLGLAGALAPASASAAPVQAAQAGNSSQTRDGLLVRADLRDEYLKGQQILVEITVQNPTSAPLFFPDLTNRPYLVHFEITDAATGKTQIRNTTAPVEDSDKRWTINPRGQRKVVLEIPSGADLRPERFGLRLTIQSGDEIVSVGPRSVRLVAPDPVAAYASDEPLTRGNSWSVPWLQNASPGADLYLLVADPSHPQARPTTSFLAHLPTVSTPWLSSSRSAEQGGRWIFWQQGERELGYIRLDGFRARDTPSGTSPAYPTWKILARGTTDEHGGLHVPIWIPNPSGEGGEVRALSIEGDRWKAYRKVVKLDSEPQAASGTDSSGSMRLLLYHAGFLDLYTLSTLPTSNLPAAGRRLLSPPAPETESDKPVPPIRGFTFGVLPKHETEPGGMAIFVWTELDNDASRRIGGSWLSLEGKEIYQVEGVEVPTSWTVRAVVGSGYDPLVVLAQDRSGQGWVARGGWSRPVSVGVLGPFDTLRVDDEGNPLLLSFSPDARLRVVSAPPAPGSSEP
jgi:hypothetical protein